MDLRTAKRGDRTRKAKSTDPIRAMRELEESLLALFTGPALVEAKNELRSGEIAAEADFLEKRERQKWKRQDLLSGGPPPQDWAACQYARTRFEVISRVALRAISDQFKPDDLVLLGDRAVKILCNICVAKLRSYEDLLIDEEHPMREHFRNATRWWLYDNLRKSTSELEASAWQRCRELDAEKALRPEIRQPCSVDALAVEHHRRVGSPSSDVSDLVNDIDKRKTERKKLRDDYKGECKSAGVRVTDEEIARAANQRWTSRTNVQKWLSCDPKYDGAPDRLIRQVFRNKPHLTKPNATAPQT
jgi:hypothetical protein